MILCTNKHTNNNHMFTIIITTTTEAAIKVIIIKSQKDNPTVFVIRWTNFLLLGLISTKEKLMKTFGDLLVAGKKLLPLYTSE